MNLALVDGELDLTGGQLHLVSGADEVRQAVQARLALVQGEWFLDSAAGVPYFERIFVKAPNLALIRSELRKIILATPGVASVSSLSVTFDRAARSLSGSFVVAMVPGTAPAAISPAAPAAPESLLVAGVFDFVPLY